METIGSRIRARREELGLSQEELGGMLGYKSRSSINKIELDARNLTQSKIKAIADALKTTPGYIMGWPEEEEEEQAVKKKHSAPELSAEEQEAVKLFAGLDPAAKAHAMQLLRSLAALQGKDSDSRE